MKIEQNISLAEYTTLGLGGEARYFCVAKSIDEIKEALQFAEEKKIGIHVLGGGSNTIFPDKGMECLVIKIELMGVSFTDVDEQILVTAGAGEDWDNLVKTCVEKGLAGIECLSGIPGLVGATPVQNVGAYGQEVSQTIAMVKAIEVATGEEVKFINTNCEFNYRTSRFKTRDLGKYIIIEVNFGLNNHGQAELKYPELKNAVTVKLGDKPLGSGTEALQVVRETVLELRAKKSMVIKAGDPNARSVGSFFTNPIIREADWEVLKQRWQDDKGVAAIPIYPAEIIDANPPLRRVRRGGGMKISAAWLVEHAGWEKGYTENGVGISSNHALALVNTNGSTEKLLALAEKIEKSVFDKFGIKLEREPYVAGD